MRRVHLIALLTALALTPACRGGSERTDLRPGSSGGAAHAGREAVGQPAARLAGGAPNQPLGEFEPLTSRDVDLYLAVMRTAADRVKNLSADDREVVKTFREMTTHPPAGGAIPSPEQMAAVQRAGDLMTLDAVVAREMGVDKRFSSISSRVSRFIGPPMTGEGDDEPMSAEERARLKVRIQKFRDLERQDDATLASCRDELVALAKQVRFMTRFEGVESR